MNINFSLNDKRNPVDPNIPDGVYDGVWHSSDTHINQFPVIQIPRDGAPMGMVLFDATFWIFKPYALILEGASRGLSFPITLTFDRESEKLVAVDGDTEFFPYLPTNFDDYKDISAETKARCFVFEVGQLTTPSPSIIKTEEVEENLQIIEKDRCPDCCIVRYSNKFGIVKILYIEHGKEVFMYNKRKGPKVDDDLEEKVLNLYFSKFDK